MIKRILFIISTLMVLLVSLPVTGQAPESTIQLAATDSVVIGNAVETFLGVPVNAWYGYTFTQTLYLQSEINVAQKVINKIGYHYAGAAPGLELEVEVWLSHTDLTSLGEVVQLTDHVKVYDGPWVIETADDFSAINITPFYYNNLSNLIVTIIEKKPGYTSADDVFYATPVPEGQQLCVGNWNDNTPYDPQNLPAAGAVSYRANTKLWFDEMPTGPALSVISPGYLDFGDVEMGQGKVMQVLLKNAGVDMLEITGFTSSNTAFEVVNTDFPIQLGMLESKSVDIRFLPDNSNLQSGEISFVFDPTVAGDRSVALSGRGISLVSVVVGEGTETSGTVPLSPYYGYSVSQTLYLQSEINIPDKMIRRIGYQYTGATTNLFVEIEVYLAHTAATELSIMQQLAGHTKVYDGPATFVSDAGFSFVETDGFFYNNTDNLLVTIIEKLPGYTGPSDLFYVTPVPEGNPVICRYVRNDQTAYNPDELPEGIPSSQRPNIKLWLSEPPTEPVVQITPESLDFGQVEMTVEKTMMVTAKNSGGGTLTINNISFSNDVFSVGNATFPVSLSIGESFAFEFRFMPDAAQLEEGMATFDIDASVPGNKTVQLLGRGLRYGVLRESFEGESFPPLGWKVVDNNNDGKGWLRNTGFAPTGQTAPRTGIACASLDVYAGSPGQTSYDDWLISPEMIWQDGDLFTFWIKRLANQSGQHWRIAYSTSGNDPSNFSVIDEIIDPSMSYTLKSYDLSNYGVMNGETYYMAFQFYSDWCWPGVIDDVMGSVLNRLENDLMLTGAATANEYIYQGTPGNFTVSFANYGIGTVDGSDYNVQLLAYLNGVETVLAQSDGVSLAPGDMTEVIVPLIMNTPGEYNIFARVNWQEDMNQVNNLSGIIPVEVISNSTVVKHIGQYPLTNETDYYNYYPINFEDTRGTSLTQTMYFTNELNTGGIVERLAYYRTFGETMSQRKIKVWMMEAQTSGLDSYIPPSEMQLVFEGKIDFNEGMGKVSIPLQHPFVFSGSGNLAVTVFYYEGPTYANNADFAYMAPDNGPTRTIYETGWNTINPEAPAYTGSTLNYPITTLVFETGNGLGSISGRVLYHADNTPVVNAMVEIIHPDFPGLQAKVFTNEQGYYTAPFAMAGQSLTVRISKYGYSDVLYENQQLNAGGSLNLGDALLHVRPMIALNGTVVKSDNQLAASSATVKLTGLDTYETTTDANGYFSFAQVWGDTDYEIEIHLQGYQPYIETISVPGADFVVPQITLLENAPAPNVVNAVSNGSNALVSWFAAGQPYPQVFRRDDGVVQGLLITPGSPDIVGGTAWKYDAILQSVQWYTYNSPNYPNSDLVMITVLGLNPDDSPNPSDVLYVQQNVVNNFGWNNLTFPQPVEAPDGFFVGISGYNNYTLLAYDDGVGEPWEWTPRTQWSNGLGSYNPLENATSPPLLANIFVRASGLTNGPLEDAKTNSYLVNLITKEQVHITRAVAPFATGDPVAAFQNLSADAVKGFESYSVFRKNNNDENWVQLNQQPVNDTSYLDTGFHSLEYGVYQYGVEANYANGVVSERALSNLLEKDMRLNLELNVETNTGLAGASAGAVVKLVNHNGNANHIYNATVGSNGSVVVGNVFKGIYSLTITHAGFYTYNDDALNLDLAGLTHQLTLSLTERLDNPFDVEVETEGHPSGSARLLWNQAPAFDNLDSYPAFAISGVGKWKLVDQDAQPTVYPANVSFPHLGEPMSFMVMNRAQTTPPLSEVYWGAYSGNQYFAGFGSATGATNNWLISDLQQHSLDYTLSFYAKSVTENYGLETFKIGYSTSTNNISDFVFITGNETAPTYWTKFTYQIPANAKYVAIRHNHTGFALLIDDISIGVESDGAIPGNGFTVYLDGSELANGFTSTHFDFTNMAPGAHIAGVKANYYSGVSEIVEVAFNLAQGTLLTVNVSDDSGQPLSNALVEIAQDGNPVANGITVGGLFTAELYPGTYEYQVSKETYSTVSGTLTIADTPLTVAVTLTSTVDLSFVVKNSSGVAIAGATVVVNDQNQLTNAAGNAVFNIAAGSVSWAVTHPDYQRLLGSQIVNTNTTLQLLMPDLQCESPQTLEAVVDQNNVTLSWEAPLLGGNGNWLHWDGAHNNNSVGTGGTVDFDVAQRFVPADLQQHDGKFVTRVLFVPREASCTYSIRVWKGGNISGPAALLVDQVVVNPVIGAWNEIFLDIPVLVDADQELWIGVRNNTTSGHPAGVDAGPAVDGKGNMINLANGGWQTLLQVAPTLNFNWSVRALVETTGARSVQHLLPLNDVADRNAPETPFTVLQHESLLIAGQPRVLNGYNIYRNGNKINSSPVVPLSYHDNGLGMGNYAYHITSVWSNGCESDASNTVNVTISEVSCPTPQGFDAWLDDSNPNLVHMAWNQPVTVEFRYDDGVRTGQIGFQSGTVNGVVGAAHPQASQLEQMSWLLSDAPDGGGPHPTVQLYVFGLNASGVPNSGDLLFTGSATNTDGVWNTFTFPEPLNAPDGFFVGVAYAGFVGLGSDDGLGAPWVYQPNTHFYSSNYTTGNWTKWEASGFSLNGMIRALGVAGARISVLADADGTPSDETASWIPAAEPVVSGAPEWNSKRGTLLGYNIYHQGQLLESLWNETSYSYSEMQINMHCYSVTAVFDDCGESEHSAEVCVDVIVGMTEKDEASAVKVYPVPAHHQLTIEGSDLRSIKLSDAKGRNLLQKDVQKQPKVQLNLDGLAPGVYILHIQTGEAFVIRKITLE